MTPEDLIQIAHDAYSYIKDETQSPMDGAEVIMMIHVMLWLNYRDESISVEDMLKSYCADFKLNFDKNWRANLDA